MISIKAPTSAGLRACRFHSRWRRAPEPARSPDIYYIILDGYARTDVMKAFFDFDNTPFLDRLEKQGFYIARDSTANYCQTPLSLSASLNSVYLDDLVKGLGTDQTELSDLIGKSNIVATLRPLGYKFVTFATGFDPTEHPEADVYLSPHPFASGFERMVIDITPLRWVWPNPKAGSTVDTSRNELSICSTILPMWRPIRSPTFTLAHVFCPHPPFIFGENGEDVSRKYIKYTSPAAIAVRAVFPIPTSSRRPIAIRPRFITSADRGNHQADPGPFPEPPIIILQSDHGSELKLDMRTSETPTSKNA